MSHSIIIFSSTVYLFSPRVTEGYREINKDANKSTTSEDDSFGTSKSNELDPAQN
jgi:hypothetical protein